MKKSFVLYYDLCPVFNMMTDEEVGKIVKEVFAYEIRGEITEFQDRMLQSTYMRITEGLDRNKVKYEKTAERNRKSALLRWNKNEIEPA